MGSYIFQRYYYKQFLMRHTIIYFMTVIFIGLMIIMLYNELKIMNRLSYTNY